MAVFAVGDNPLVTSDYIHSDSSKNLKDMSKAHMKHKPYSNDFAKCLEAVMREKFDTGGLEYDSD